MEPGAEELRQRIAQLSKEIGLWSTNSDSGIDESYVEEYDRKQSIVSPGKVEMAETIAAVLSNVLPARARVLDIGSGTGFLGERLLEAREGVGLTCADLSQEMLRNAGIRLERFGERVAFTTVDFNSPAWLAGLGRFDAVVSLEALHRLRDERTAGFCAEVRSLLSAGGWFLDGAPFRSRYEPVQDWFETHWARFAQRKGREVKNIEVPLELLREFKRVGRAARDAGALARFNRLDASTWCESLRGAGFSSAEILWRSGSATVIGASV